MGKYLIENGFKKNTQNGTLTGVSAGVAARLGVDVAWVRLAFILLAATFGVGLVLYIVLFDALSGAEERSNVEQKALLLM